MADYYAPYLRLHSLPSGAKLDNPATMPTGAVYAVAFSPDGSLLAVGSSASPYLLVYNTSTWAKLDNPATLPTGMVYAVAFSPDGSLLAVGSSASPFLLVYNTSTWAKLGNPATLPTHTGIAVAFSPDGSLLAVGNSASPYLLVYNTSTWAKLDNPATLPTGLVYTVAFSPDGATLFCLASNTLLAYETESLVKLTLPASMGGVTSNWFFLHTFPREMPPPPDPPPSPAHYVLTSPGGALGIEGEYYENGTFNGKPKYLQDGGLGAIYWEMDEMGEGYVWKVWDETNITVYEWWSTQGNTPGIGTYYNPMTMNEVYLAYVAGS